MLKIIAELAPFIEDCYRRINVREYAKLKKISPPTASNLLNLFHRKGLLKREKYRNYIFYYANKESKDFIDLSRIYWRHELRKLVVFIEKKLVSPTIILFGSLAKAETKKDSDIDIAILANKKELDFKDFDNKRKIQVFWFNSLKEIGHIELANNIINGYVLKGRLKF